MSGKSKKTVSFGLRLPIGLVRKIDKRVKDYPGDMNRNDYIRRRLEYDIHRKHIKHED